MYNSSMRQYTPEQLGCINVYCQVCLAFDWLQKRVSISSIQNPSFENCYKQGAIVLKASQDISKFISNLFRGDDALSNYFQDNIRQCNSALAFIFLKCTPDLQLPAGNIQNFKIYGELYHMQRHINAELHDNDSLYYAQLYFYDPTFALEQRIIKNLQLNPDLLYQLTETFYVCNPFINIYKTTAKQIQSFAINTTEEICVVLNP